MRKLIFLLPLLLAGCAAKTTVTNLPTGVTSSQVSSWATAVNVLQQAQAATHAAVTGTIQLRQAGVYGDTAAYQQALQAEGKAEQAEIQFAQFLQNTPNNWSQSIGQQITSYTTQILTLLSNAAATGILGQKAQGASQTIAQLVANSISLVQSIQNGISSLQAALFWKDAVGCFKPVMARLGEGYIELGEPVPCEVKQ